MLALVHEIVGWKRRRNSECLVSVVATDNSIVQTWCRCGVQAPIVGSLIPRLDDGPVLRNLFSVVLRICRSLSVYEASEFAPFSPDFKNLKNWNHPGTVATGPDNGKRNRMTSRKSIEIGRYQRSADVSPYAGFNPWSVKRNWLTTFAKLA
jgi:hypothetical protein